MTDSHTLQRISALEKEVESLKRCYLEWTNNERMSAPLGGKLEDMSLQQIIGEWGDVTFPEVTVASIFSHFDEEADELAEEVFNYDVYKDNVNALIEEAADCYILLLHLAHKLGKDLDHEAREKMERNKKRSWNSVATIGGHWKHVPTT